MQNNSLFIVIEGLDGSGKTSVARQLTYFLQTVLHKKVKLSFEPHDPSCGGLYIRQVLEKKITTFSHETLALAFAANRRDHGDRVITKWLEAGADRIVICDRYYLSSLVYQSNDGFSMDDVMRLNKNARKPDLIFFMNVSNEVCYQRMDIRNKPKELFEENLSQTREKYLKAISFLKEKRQETIIEIDANGTIESVLAQMAKSIYHFHPHWEQEALLEAGSFTLQKAFSFFKNNTSTTASILNTLKARQAKQTTLPDQNLIKADVDSIFQKLSFSELGNIFLEHLSSLGYTIGSQIPGTTSNAFSLDFPLPRGLQQRGVALLLDEPQRYDQILGIVSDLKEMADFMFVFSSGDSEAVGNYFERDSIVTKSGRALFPRVQMVTESDLREEFYALVSK